MRTANTDLLERLQKDTICGACYLIWMFPRTQSEVLKIIYNVNDPSKVNQKPVIKCRKDMVAAGYLEDLDKQIIRNKRFVSTSKPYIEYLENTLKRERRRAKIGDDMRRAIDIIYNSNWFREIFKTEYILRKDNYPMPAAIGMYRNEKGRLCVEDSLYIVATILHELAELSFLFEEYLKERKQVDVSRPSIEEVVNSGDFDKIAREYANQVDPNILRRMYLELFLDDLTPLAFVELNRNVLLIPRPVAELFVRAGRSAHTLRLLGPQSLSESVLEKLKEMGIYEDLIKLAGGEEKFYKNIEKYVIEYFKQRLEKI
ncbi:hypothetical protein Ferp_0410 [Ferroglobus placidus DSM 10642]|uniref:Uncharacterized protein n=1 Tax=Ferroglobus placidus (strain DSM 10642 / AEDII12DO) TaxID=589924 RepID=D3S2Q7_FERPA|nr:hypothetical protein [Ferroglobus placidus]ADC64587.1 hypothetical protein Ferp_0410 [Ferroglobus placidus DSM 10642]